MTKGKSWTVEEEKHLINSDEEGKCNILKKQQTLGRAKYPESFSLKPQRGIVKILRL